MAAFSLFILLVVGAGFFLAIGALNWIYEKTEKLHVSPVLPPLFWIATLVSFIGFHVFLYDSFVIPELPTLGIAGFSAVTALSLWLSLPTKQKTGLVSLTSLGSTLLGSVFLIWRASSFVQTVNVLLILASLSVLAMIKTNTDVVWRGFELLRNLVMVPVSWFVQLSIYWKERQKLFSSKENKAFSVGSLLKIVALTSVLLLVFVPLLLSADAVFRKILENFWENLFGRIITSLMILPAIGVVLIGKVKSKTTEIKLKVISLMELMVPLMVTGVVFAGFLAIQARYLFGNDDILSQFDLTYSEYVNAGFFELLAVTSIGAIMIYFLGRKLHEVAKSTKQKSLVWLSQLTVLTLVVELGLMLGSAVKRNSMYIDAYSLSRPRLAASWFMIWLGVELLLLLGFGFFKKISEKMLLAGGTVALLGLMVAYSFINMDQVIVDHVQAQSGKVADRQYHSVLSEDVAGTWPTILSEAQSLVDSYQNLSLTDDQLSELVRYRLALLTIRQRHHELYLEYGTPEEAKKSQDYLAFSRHKTRCLNNIWYEYNRTGYLAPGVEEMLGLEPKPVPDPVPVRLDPDCARIIGMSFEQYLAADEINSIQEDLSESNKDYHSWLSYNYAEKQAFEFVHQQPELYFEQLNQMLFEIEKLTQTLPEGQVKQVQSRLINEYEQPLTRQGYYRTQLSEDL